MVDVVMVLDCNELFAQKRPERKEIKKTAKVFTASCLLSGPLTPSYIMLTEKEININIKGFFCGVCPCLILKQQYLKRNLLFKYKYNYKSY